MSRLWRMLLIAALVCGLLPAAPALADVTLPPNCQEIDPDLNPSTPEIYLVCLPLAVPPQFDVVVFAHGYVPPGAPMTKYYEQLQLSDGQFLPLVANGLGYVYASTSYHKNGLAVKEGLADTVQLVQWLKGAYPGRVRYVYLIGASEGGLITTLAAEKYPQAFNGGLALCGPIGDFRSQLNYWGDFRVLFDYFYPDVLPPTAVNIPASAIAQWETVLAPQIAGLIGNPANQHTTEQLLKTSRAPIDLANPGPTAVETTVGILSYNILATNEGKLELGGQPFDNRLKWYVGSDNDVKLNGLNGVQRFRAQLPLSSLLDIQRNYQTTGKLAMPLVTMHTTGDPIVPYWHETLYNAKALFGGSVLKHVNIPVLRYGHCNFKTQEALVGFALMVRMATGKLPEGIATVLNTPELQKGYADLMQQYQP